MAHRILIIDNDNHPANSLRKILANEGFCVDVAGDGREGLKLQIQNPYGLIITDIVLPIEDGLEVIMWVRSNTPNTKIIAISGEGYFNSHDYLVMAKELGASFGLCKPFDMGQLVAGTIRLLNETTKS